MRLNAAVRQEITRNATKVLNEREAALLKIELVLEAECYTHAFPLATRKAVEVLQEGLHRQWFRAAGQVSYNVAGQHVRMRTGPAGRAVPCSYYDVNTLGAAITLEHHEKLVESVRAWQGDSEQFKKDKSLAEKTLETILKSVGSTETLFKVWPEGKKFYSTPPLTPVVKTGVPAVQIEALNKMIGLVAA